jgi:acyl carrier protein
MDVVTDKVREILAVELRIELDRIVADAKLRADLGMDSVAALNILFAAEEAFGIEGIEVTELAGVATSATSSRWSESMLPIARCEPPARTIAVREAAAVPERRAERVAAGLLDRYLRAVARRARVAYADENGRALAPADVDAHVDALIARPQPIVATYWIDNRARGRAAAVRRYARSRVCSPR